MGTRSRSHAFFFSRYSAARRGVEPTIYALSTLMFLTILILLLLVNKISEKVTKTSLF